MKGVSPYQSRMVMAAVSLVGLFASGYLFYTYVTGGPIVCGLVSGCELVRASRWAYTFGLPRPLFGLLFYAGVFGLLVARVATTWRPRLLYRLTMLAAVLGFIESAFLFLVQWLDIKAFCLWCLISAITATVIACVAPFDRYYEQRHVISTERELKHYFVMLLVFMPLAFFGFVTLTRAQPHAATPAPATIQSAQPAALPQASLLTPTTPVSGPSASSILAVAFVDFACPNCQTLFANLRRLREEYGARIRFAVRFFPNPAHQQSLDAAHAAFCAGAQGKFFEYADMLFLNQGDLSRRGLWRYAAGIGLNQSRFLLCLDDAPAKTAALQDRGDALTLGVTAAPVLFVQETKFDITSSYEDWANKLSQELWLKK